MQLTTLVNDAPLDEEGNVLWQQHLQRMAMMVKAMTDPQTIIERAEMAERAEFTPLEIMSGREREAIEDMLRGLFKEADKDGNGVLDRQEFHDCLESADLGLQPYEVGMLLDVFDANEDGKMSYGEFTDMAYEVLLQAAREKAIVEAQMAAWE